MLALLSKWGVQLLLVATLMFQLTILHRLRNETRGEVTSDLPGQSDATKETSNVKLSIDSSSTKGRVAAKVVVVEFTDYECPYCRQHASSTFAQIDKEYVQTGRIRYALRDFPLAIHKSAFKLAQLAACAGRQGKFWEMHDRLVAADLESLNEDKLTSELGLTVSTMHSCMRDEEIAASLNGELAEGKRIGIRGTPTFYIGVADSSGNSVDVKRVLRGAQPYATFKKAIDDVLRNADS